MNFFKPSVTMLMACFFFVFVQAIAQGLYVGESRQLSPPSVNGVLGGAAWTSDHPNQVFVSGNEYGATVTVMEYVAGTTTIDCSYAYTYYIGAEKHHGTGHAYYYITCLPSQVSLDKSMLQLSPGQEATLTYSNSSGYDLQSVYWTTSDANVATVEYSDHAHDMKTVTISACNGGECFITCEGFTGKTAPVCKVVVTSVPPTSISLSPKDLSLVVGEVADLRYTLSPANASSNITWSSTDETVAQVSNSGRITAMDVGTATIRATTENGLSDACTISVSAPPFELISIIPEDGMGNVPTTQNIEVNFSTDIVEGPSFSGISLVEEENGNAVKGQIVISDKTIVFTPDEELKSATKYCFKMPRNAIADIWGNGYNAVVMSNFMTIVTLSDIKNLVVCFVNGDSAVFSLQLRPHIIYDKENQQIVISDMNREYRFAHNMISEFFLDYHAPEKGEDTGVEEIPTIQNDASIKMKWLQEDEISISGLLPHESITIYTLGGICIQTLQADEYGCVVVSMREWMKGSYVVATQNISFKILKQ